MRTVVSNQQLAGQDFSRQDFGDRILHECNLALSNMQRSNVSSTFLDHCDLRNTDYRGLVVRMDCTQGVGNKVEPWQAAAMLYWLIHTFELPVDMKSRIESIIAPFGPRLKTFFDSPY